MDADTVLCLEDYSDQGDRAGHELWSADVVFAPAMDENVALDAARGLLPEDAVEDSCVVGTNASDPHSCLSVDYHSERLEDHAREVVERLCAVLVGSNGGSIIVISSVSGLEAMPGQINRSRLRRLGGIDSAGVAPSRRAPQVAGAIS